MNVVDEEPLTTKNRTAREHCRTCCNTGWALVGTSAGGTDQMAPCPFCEEGRRMELAHYTLPGYWQGRAPLVTPLCRCGEKPAPPNQAAIEEMTARLAQSTREAVDADVLNRVMREARFAGTGPCGDCGQVADRIAFGTFDLCDRCVRARLAAQARMDAAVRVMRSGDDDLRGDVPPAGLNPPHTTTEGGP